MNRSASSILETAKHLEYGTGITFETTEEVDVIIFDEWAAKNSIDHIDFMWLDMQGYELNMLKKSHIALSAKIIYSEIEFIEAYKNQYIYTDFIEWMNDNGFKLIAIDFDPEQPYRKIIPEKAYKTGEAWFGNAVFLNIRFDTKL